jgi:pimeloyl-ACP methyl ester carboxylesterase
MWRTLPAVIIVVLTFGCALHPEIIRETPYDAYRGAYQMKTNLEVIVRPEGKRLMAKVSGQDYFEIFPRGHDSFFFKVVEAEVLFIRSKEGAVSGFDLHQNGEIFRFERKSAIIPKDYSRRVDAGGYEVRMSIRGSGTPTVIFESGLGESLDAWEKEFSEVAAFTRAVAYDRSGLGLSERARTSRTAEHVAQDLHRALRNAGIAPPFLLVGNSAGGLYLRVFAHLYPGEVSGMVLVEPSSEDYEKWLHQTHPGAFQASEQELERSAPGFRDHVAAWETSLEQARRAWPLPPVPIVVLTGMHHEPAEAEKRQMWLTMHERFVARVPECRHIVSQISGHGLANTEPELVIRAVRETIDRIRMPK